MAVDVAEFDFEKSIWVTADFDQMRWHDCLIHGVSFDLQRGKFFLDIDYIFSWVTPVPNDGTFQFWVAPSTLMFENVYDLSIDLEHETGWYIMSIDRKEEGAAPNAELIAEKQDWKWCLETCFGEISFRSTGFTQYTRKVPRLTDQQYFGQSERGGSNFELSTTATTWA